MREIQFAFNCDISFNYFFIWVKVFLTQSKTNFTKHFVLCIKKTILSSNQNQPLKRVGLYLPTLIESKIKLNWFKRVPCLYFTYFVQALCIPYRLHTPFSKHRPSGPMLSISWNVRLFVRVFVRLFTFEVPFKRLSAPTFRSRMSNIFRDLESLGKKNGKKWSHIWTFSFENCQKLPKKKVFFVADFALKTW